MNELVKKMQAKKRFSTVLTAAFIVFMNCFGFPVLNLTKEWPVLLWANRLFTDLWGFFLMGLMLAGLFPQKRAPFIAIFSMVLVLAGMGCRYLLEFGEVSNTYNFTPPNIALHVVVTVAMYVLVWLVATRRMKA